MVRSGRTGIRWGGLLLAFGTWAQTASVPRDFVWRVEGKPGVLFLAGSLHELRGGDRPSLSLYQAYALADRVVFEADIGEFDQPAFRERVKALSELPAGQSLYRKLDAETRKKLGTIAVRNELPEDAFDRWRPWFAGSYAILLLLSESGFKEDHGVDRYFYDRAVREGKSRDYLETGKQQLELLARIPDDEALQSLRQDLDGGVEYARSLVDAWAVGDAAKFDRLSRDNSADTPESFRKFVDDRNRAWLPKLEKWLGQTNCTLVVVGAGHLVGTNGLVQLLSVRGYPVRQLPDPVVRSP